MRQHQVQSRMPRSPVIRGSNGSEVAITLLDLAD